MFDKIKYRGRRARGLRGQDDKPIVAKPAEDDKGNWLEGPGQMIQGRIHAFNRKYFRQKNKNRLMTKPGYAKGVKIKEKK